MNIAQKLKRNFTIIISAVAVLMALILIAMWRERGTKSAAQQSMEMKEATSMVVMARATSNSGETQVNELIHNPPGYHHNVIQRLYVEVV